jgi:glycosyltransferase involved in cell wall biosynthesis
MKIAIFTDTFLPELNGAAFSIEATAKQLAKKHEVMVFAPRLEFGKTVKFNRDYTLIRCTSIPFPAFKKVRIVLPNIINIYNSTKIFKPDIIHLHTPGPLGIAAVLIAKSTNTPLAGTFHTLFTEQLDYISPLKIFNRVTKANGYLKRLDSVQKLTVFWKSLPRRKEKEKDTRLQKLTWKGLISFYSKCDKISVPSKSVKKELDKRGLRYKTSIIPETLDVVNQFTERKSYKSNNQILYLGRIDEQKNIDLILKAFKLASEKSPEIKLTIAGGGPLLNGMKNLAKQLSISNKTKFTGWISSRDEVTKTYKQSDIFVMVSSETQGLVATEAMACGMPVIGIKKYGLADLITHGKNGYLVDPGNYKQIAKFILKITNDKNLRVQLGKNARKVAEAYDVKVVTKQFENLYKEIIKKDPNEYN